jgi:hypothetical protein
VRSCPRRHPSAAPSASPTTSPQSEKDTRQQKARRRHQDKAAEGEERNATPDLLLTHPNAIFATNKRRQMKHLKLVSRTLAKTHEKHLTITANIRNIQIKHLQHTYEIYAISR